MKKIFRYIYVIFALALLSCERPSLDSPTDIILAPEAGYIRFSTGVASKAPMIENLRGETFGVFGYSYGFSTKWDVARPLANPDVFHNLTVNCSETNGSCSYDIDSSTDAIDLKSWELSKKYSFFAYYPMTEGNNGVSVSGADVVNMPTVTYNLPLKSKSEGEVDPDNLLDLMTAYSVDKTAYDGLVGFTFQHRLFCIEILAQNFNKDVTEINDGETVTVDADEIISDLTLTIDNLAYQSITIPMMKGDSEPRMVANSRGPVKFRILDPEKSVVVPSQEGANATTISLSRVKENEEDDSYDENFVMLIPQDASQNFLTGSLEYKLNDDTEYTTSTFTSDLKFQEGMKYTIVLSFTGRTVVIAVAEAGSWNPHTVTYEFD